MIDLLRTIIVRLECIASLLADQQGRYIRFDADGYSIEPKGMTYRIHLDPSELDKAGAE